MITLLIVITGLMGGIYFAFSIFLLKSLSQLPELQAARAMNKINDVIVNTVFLPMFIVSTLWYAGLIIWSIVHWQNLNSAYLITAALVYIVGMFLVTAFGNVPLNNRLQRSASSDAALIRCWRRYHRQWAELNHLRTISCTVSLVLLVITQRNC